MPKNATLVERVNWHIVHAKCCACREMPASIVVALKDTKFKICSRGHKYLNTGPCSICWPGGKKKMNKNLVTYVALLRGINVGGNNVIKMAELKLCFEGMGFADVSTYIQSGNVMFSTDVSDEARLEDVIQKALSERFKYNSRVVVVSRETLACVVGEAPLGFGKEPGKYRYDVIFVKKPLTSKKVIKAFEVREGVDSMAAGRHALYFSRLIARATQSRLSKIVQKPEYQYMTIRNWNTTTKLLDFMEP